MSLFVSPPGPVATAILDIADIKVYGGFGLVRLTYTGANASADRYEVRNFIIRDCTGPGISSLASDHPYWKIDGMVQYSGGGPAGSGGVALAGYCDASDIKVNVTGTQYAVKLGQTGCNARVLFSFVRSGAYTTFPRMAVWLVPSSSNTSSRGLNLEGKFGNENKDDTRDYHILVADEDAATGSDFSDRLPKISADSSGYALGVTVNAYFSDAGSAPGGPLIYTTTPNTAGWHIVPILGDAKPSFIMQFRTAPGPDETRTTNIIGPVVSADRDAPYNAVIPSNGYGTYRLIDADGQMSRFEYHPMVNAGGGNLAGYNALAATANFAAGGSSTTVATTDSLGGTDAAEVTFAGAAVSSGYFMTITATNVTVGKPTWIEFEVAQGSATALNDFLLLVRYSDNSATFFKQFMPVSSTAGSWVPHRFLFVPPAASINIQVLFYAPNYDASHTKLKLGRIRVYQAREPRLNGHTAMGGSSTAMDLIGKASANVTAASNASTTETDLMSYTVPANTLNLDGRLIRVTAWGITANNANAKSLKAYWGGVSFGTATLTASLAGLWRVEVLIVRSGSNTQVIQWKAEGNVTSSPKMGSAIGAKNDSASNMVKLTGTGGAANDITQQGMIVELLG